MKKEIIGVTGPIHAGKSSVSNYLAQKGFSLFDADKEAHAFYGTNEGKDVLINIFGTDVISSGEIDFSFLRKAVASNHNKKKELESAVFSYVLSRAKDYIEQHKDDNIVLDVPLLLDAHMEVLCTHIILVESNLDNRKARIESEGKDPSSLLTINANYPLEETSKIADFRIQNDGNLHELHEKIDKLLFTIAQ